MVHEDTACSIEVGEKVHVVEHRRFEKDFRRHFVGVVETTSANTFRLKGFLFVYDPGTDKFIKKETERVRVFCLDNLISITILPPETDLNRAEYSLKTGELVFTDHKHVSLDVGAFGVHG